MKRSERTCELLIMHCQNYPKLQIQDIFKFLYQSSFGCEHLVSDPETVTNYIQKEYESISGYKQPVVEQLDGAYCRVPLSYLKHGLSAHTLGKLFLASAKKESKGKEDLIQKLKVAKELVYEKRLPFSQDEYEKAMKEWEMKGYPAVRHSDVFRGAYQPSYRVIANEYIPFLPLFTELDKRLEKGTVKAAIEGGSASGKTTLSEILTAIYGCTVFHMDDFFLQPQQRTPERYAEAGGNIDRERFLTEVLKPLCNGEVVNYRKFDCSTRKIMDAIQITPQRMSVIEGAYSMHPQLSGYYDLSVFLEISPELQKERILRRNSPHIAEKFFNEWIPLEKIYFEKMKVEERCDIYIRVAKQS